MIKALGSLQDLRRRQQLFVYRDLWTWINDPFQPPPVTSVLEQLQLGLS